MFLFLVINLYDIKQQIALAISVGFGILIRFCTYKKKAPSDNVYVIFQLGAFFMGMVWVYMLANIIVDMLELFAMLTGMSTALLGLTILSWGNSVGDAFCSSTISKQGFGEMAVTGCIAGPVFNLMLGLGLITAVVNYHKEGGIIFDVHNSQDTTNFVTIVSSIFITVALMALTILSGFKMTPREAKIITLMYFAAIVIISLLSI